MTERLGPMDKTERLIVQTERLLGQVESLQVALDQLRIDLGRHVLALSQELARQRKKPGLEPLRTINPRERRSSPRRRGNPVSVAICNGSTTGEPFQGWVLDRSRGGLRLLVDEEVPTGTLLRIRPAKSLSGFPWVQVKVRNCNPERKSWNLGCQFVEKMSWEDLQQFG